MKRTKVNTDKTIKIVGYCRISAAKENDVSIPAQKSKIRQWAKLNDAEMLAMFDDNGISGTKTNRPAFQQAFELAIREKAIIVTYSLSRFGRSTVDILNNINKLTKSGAGFVSLSENFDTTTAAGNLVLTIFAALAEFESKVGGERTKAALDHRKARGLKTGGHMPFGYDVDSNLKLIPNPAEQKVITYIRQMHARGKNMLWIANRLNERGISTKKQGGRWFAQQIKKILTRKTPKL